MGGPVMGGQGGNTMPGGQPERINPLTCKQCVATFEVRNRNGVVKRFCSRDCKAVWHNEERSRMHKETHKKTAAVRRSRKRTIRTLDDLATAEGLPPGCYPPGAMGLLGRKRSGIDIVPPAERPALLFEAAHRLGLSEEGPMLRAARAARASEAAA